MLSRISLARQPLLAATVFMAVLAAPATAQQIGNSGDTVTPFNVKHSGRFGSLRDGEAKPNVKDDKELLDVAGRYLVHRLTWYEKLDGSLNQVLKEFNELMNSPATKSGKNREFMELLAPELIQRFDDVFKQKFETNQTSITNAALLLPVLAKCRQNAVHHYLLELAVATPSKDASVEKKDKKVVSVHPFIRMAAIKGLGELNSPGGPQLDDPANLQQQNDKRARELARLEAIKQFIESPYPPEGQGVDFDGAYAYVRREGVKALAQMRLPVYAVQGGKVTGPVAYYLLHIANGGPMKVGPKISLSEKLEAAIGLCELNARDHPEYNAALAVQVIGKVLAEFADEYNKDYEYFSAKDTKDLGKRQPLLPWSSYATRLEAGLETMVSMIKESKAPASKNLDGLRENVKSALKTIAERRQPVNTLELQSFQTFVQSIRPASGEVYEGSKDYVLPVK